MNFSYSFQDPDAFVDMGTTNFDNIDMSFYDLGLFTDPLGSPSYSQLEDNLTPQSINVDVLTNDNSNCPQQSCYDCYPTPDTNSPCSVRSLSPGLSFLTSNLESNLHQQQYSSSRTSDVILLNNCQQPEFYQSVISDSGLHSNEQTSSSTTRTVNEVSGFTHNNTDTDEIFTAKHTSYEILRSSEDFDPSADYDYEDRGEDENTIINEQIDPYVLGIKRRHITKRDDIRTYFRQDLDDFSLKPGDYLETVEATKYAMWLYFTAKQGIILRQLRAKGLRDLRKKRNTNSAPNHHIRSQFRALNPENRTKSANFSYCCQNCGSVLLVAKKKVPGSYNDGVNNKAPYNVWVIRTINDHTREDCEKQKNEQQLNENLKQKKAEPEKLTCPHTLDLIKTIKNQYKLDNKQLLNSVVGILQDIFHKKVYTEGRISYIAKLKNEPCSNSNLRSIETSSKKANKYIVHIDREYSIEEFEVIKKKQQLMVRMVRKRLHEKKSISNSKLRANKLY